MEGESVSSRSWSILVRLLPWPVRWLGVETVRFVRWFDRGLDQTIEQFYTSPVFSIVTVTGVATVGMTIFLILSMGNSSGAKHPTQTAHVKRYVNSRAELEKRHDWSTEDRWRIAHLFVPHKPKSDSIHVEIDSRLLTSDRPNFKRHAERKARQVAAGLRMANDSDIDVRLELGRPHAAEQDSRLVFASVRDSSYYEPIDSGLRRRDPRLLVHASWERIGDCDSFVYAGLPTHQPYVRTVPDPIDDLQVVPKPARQTPSRRQLPVVSIDIPNPPVKGHPDLSFEMEMTRHFSIAGMFPPGSHPIRQSKRSEFPLDDHRHIARNESEWQQFEPTDGRSVDVIRQYAGLETHRSQSEQDYTLDEAAVDLPSMAEVMLRIFLKAPQAAVTGKAQRTNLIVRNEGQGDLTRIEVDEPLDRLRTVTDATPDGVVEEFSDDQTGVRKTRVHREIDGLPSGESYEFGLEWIPDGGRKQVHRARVISHAAVSTVTEVTKPPQDQKMSSVPPEPLPEGHSALICDIRYFDAAYVGDEVEVEIIVRNTGNTPLNDVKVEVDVPDQLAHPDGKSVVFAAGNLDINGTNQTIVKMSARQVGEAENQLRVASAEQIEARGKTRINVLERAKKPNPVPQPAPAVPQQNFNGCFCQPMSMFKYSPSSSFDESAFWIE